MRAQLVSFTPETCVEAMCESLEAWEAVDRFAAFVIRGKRN